MLSCHMWDIFGKSEDVCANGSRQFKSLAIGKSTILSFVSYSVGSVALNCSEFIIFFRIMYFSVNFLCFGYYLVVLKTRHLEFVS